MKCFSCGAYFRQHPYNRTNQCDECSGFDASMDDEMQVEIDLLRNKSGRTQPVINEDRGLDSYD